MPWGGRKEEELPERLKGKSPEQVLAELEAADKLQAKLAEREAKDAERDGQLVSMNETLGGLRDSLKAINERTPVSTRTIENNEPASFITDPDQAFAERAAPLTALVMQSATIAAKGEALRAFQRKQATEKNNIDGVLFERFEGEILEIAKTCSAQQLANPATWAHLFYNVKGRHTDEIVSNPKAFFTEDATRHVNTDKPADDTLTEQELAIAKKMGVKPENYLANKKASTAMPF